MSTQQWFHKKLEVFKNDREFRLETLILTITESICQKMATQKMTRKELAEKLQISPPAVTKILNGNSNFTLKTLVAIADALDQDLSIEFREREPVTSPPRSDGLQVSSTSGEGTVSQPKKEVVPL